MPFAATWVGLGIVILSAMSQTEEDKYHMTIPRPTHVAANGIISIFFFFLRLIAI